MILFSAKIEYPKKLKQRQQQSSLFHCLVLLHNTEVRGFRILFGKTVNGQRTGSNAQTAKSYTHNLYSYKYNVLNNLTTNSLTKPTFLAEYINLFWQHQWVYEWVSSYKTVRNLPVYVRRTNFIDIANITRFHIYHQYSNPFKSSKKSRQKRKKVIPKNKFSTGLPFGFSWLFRKQLQSII